MDKGFVKDYGELRGLLLEHITQRMLMTPDDAEELLKLAAELRECSRKLRECSRELREWTRHENH
jgi:hypothetical protein